MKFNKKVFLITIVLMLTLISSALAAPSSVGLWYYGNASDLVVVTNPAKASIASYERAHNISGYAQQGTELALYISNGSSYVPVYKDGAPLVWTAGASGMFVKPIYLNKGRNNLLLWASKDGRVQTVRLKITVLSSSFLDLLNKYSLQ